LERVIPKIKVPATIVQKIERNVDLCQITRREKNLLLYLLIDEKLARILLYCDNLDGLRVETRRFEPAIRNSLRITKKQKIHCTIHFALVYPYNLYYSNTNLIPSKNNRLNYLSLNQKLRNSLIVLRDHPRNSNLRTQITGN
jgi:hypothetical protein